LKDKSIKLIKWQKAGFKNLLGNSCIKRRIRRIAIRDYQMSEYKKPFSLIQHCTYNSSNILTLYIKDYRWKHSCLRELSGIPLLTKRAERVSKDD